MAKNTVTFELGGRVEIQDLEKGIIAFRRLISALTPRNAQVSWIVEDLQPGSTVATIRGEAENPAIVEKIVRDYESVGDVLSRHEELSLYRKQVVKAADAIVALAGTVDYVRFETPDDDYMILGNGVQTTKTTPSVSIGAVKGRVQTLSNRGGLRFNLYDTIHDKAVACYLSSGQESLMREAWGKLATVSGKVSRDASTGRPIAIRQIMDVEILDDVLPGAYRRARGVVPWHPGYKKPEEIIRELRDA